MVNKHTFPLILVDIEGTREHLFAHIHTAVMAGAKSLLVLACDANGFTAEQLDPYLKRVPIPIFGGIFPEIIAGEHPLVHGSIVCGLAVSASVHPIEKLSDPNEDYLPQVEKLVAVIPPGETLLMLVDGLSKRISTLLENVNEALGTRHQYIGGGAGSLSFVQKPCLFSNQGLRGDCAQITALALPISIGIEHGWHKFAGPFFVTGAHDHTITTLDYRPAFEVYREVVEADSQRHFSDTAFVDLVKSYPFGLARLEGDVVVRAPLFHDGNNLICAGEVPVNHIVFILKGETENLLRASRQCAGYALRIPLQVQPSMALLFDCISRSLFLEGRFMEEVRNIQQELPADVPLLGGVSLGEIADDGHTGLEFFNKTVVLGVLGTDEEIAE